MSREPRPRRTRKMRNRFIPGRAVIYRKRLHSNRCFRVNGTFVFAFRMVKPSGFQDGRAGEQAAIAGKDFGDFVVWRRDDVPAYHLAVVADDIAMGITEVVRGEDCCSQLFGTCCCTARSMLSRRHFITRS